MLSALRLLSLLLMLMPCVSQAAVITMSSTDEVVAVFPQNFPPHYQVSPEGKPFGYAIEVMDEVARRAGLTVTYLPVENWSEVWEQLRAGNADLVPNMGITPHRGETMLFTPPYESFALRIFVNRKDKQVQDITDLKDKNVCTTQTNIANTLIDQIHFTQYGNAEKCVKALVNGEVYAVILPDIVVRHLTNRIANIDHITAVGKPIKEIHRAIAVSKDRPGLFETIDQHMRAYLSSDEFNDTRKSWGREPQPLLSIDQLIKLNLLLVAALIILIGLILRFRVRNANNGDKSDTYIEARIVSYIAVLFVVTLLTSAASLWFLYNTAFEGQKSRLVNIVQSRARIIESIARFDLGNREQLGLKVEESLKGVVSQIQESHRNFIGFDRTGEFTFAKRSEDNIVFMLQQRHIHDLSVAPNQIPWLSPDAEPMRRALSGRSGTLIGLDYRGVSVLAAHEPVEILNAGIVAKIDLAEIREPYIRAALIVFSITLAVLTIGILIFFRLTVPILKTLSQGYARLKAIIDHSPNVIAISDTEENIVIASPGYDQLAEKLPKSGEASVHHRDGTVHSYISSTFPLTVNDATFGFCHIATDITERVTAEVELKQLALAFQSTSEAMVITDLNAVILTVNEAFEEITGYTKAEVMGKNSKVLKSGKHSTEFYQELWHTLLETGQWKGEIWNRRKNGEIYPERLNINTVYDDQLNPINYVSVFADITNQKQSQDQLYYLAYHDPLTKLPNRLLFRDRLEHILRLAHRENSNVALFTIDVDRFKNINDSLGHPTGDTVLKNVASRLKGLVRDSDTVARMGGDEFTIIADNCHDLNSISILAQKIVRGMDYKLTIDGHQIMSSISLGIAVYPQDGSTYEDLLKNADNALYKAKEMGRNNYQFFTEELGQNAYEKLVMQNQMVKSIDNNEFVLFYQPQFDAKTGRLASAEALIRWQHPEAGFIPPDHFIPLAEESGLIIPLGEWILLTACQQAQNWLQSGYQFDRIAVNLSGTQIERAGLFEMINTVLEKTQLPPDKLELEVTEGFIMSNVQESIQLLESFSKMGITIAIDDFGTGHSSLAYLKRLPVNTLKIDRSFVRDLPDDNEGAEISKAIIALGHSLGMTIIAEGVETQEQWEFLYYEGCNIMQGYLLGKPMSAELFETQCFESEGEKS